MKKIFTVLALMIGSFAVSAQEQSNSNSKWKETNNGVTYQMSAEIKGVSTKNVEKPHITLNYIGDLKLLTKVALKGKELHTTIPVIKGGQNIDVEPGHYVFQFHHEKLGLREFEVDLKRNDNHKMVVTLD